MNAITSRLGTSLAPSALGLLVAMQAEWCARHFRRRLAAMDLEMETGALSLVNQLTRLFPQLRLCAAPLPSLPFLDGYAQQAEADRQSLHRSLRAAVIILALAWAVEFFRVWTIDPRPSPILHAVRSTLFILVCAYLPAHALCVDLFHRSRTAVPIGAATLTLAWFATRLCWNLLGN